MNKVKLVLAGFVIILSTQVIAAQDSKDWAKLATYVNENAALTEAPKAVFMGNSITEYWRRFHPDYFTSHNYAGRGISGQVTSQLLCRFRPDVIDLHPQVVVILGGTNDIAQNYGFITNEHIMDNIISMVELARVNNIKVILCSVLPVGEYKSRSAEFNAQKQPAKTIIDLNNRIKAYADEQGIDYVDYWTPMADENGAMKAELSRDGLHPNPDAYYAMEELVTPVIEKLLKK